MQPYFHRSSGNTIVPIYLIESSHFSTWIKTQSSKVRQWMKVNDFNARSHQFVLMMNPQGELQRVYVGVESFDDLWAVANLPLQLPVGSYCIENKLSIDQFEKLLLGWGLGAYQFVQFKEPKRKAAKLFVSREVDLAKIENEIEGVYLVRDLINLPTDNLGPSELSTELFELAKLHDALFSEIIGEALVEEGLTAIYTVGRASDDAPRLLELEWGNPAHKKVAIVGKGVCFDSGGLNLKSTQGIQQMKKDMAGAAHAMALAKMIMQANLPIHLHLYIPAVENVVSGNAYHPGDIIRMRNGKTVEVTNTDAEGRLILADAFVKACEESPDILIDFASLTGAARVALGTELPALFSPSDSMASMMIESGVKRQDPVWRMPLVSSYREQLKSDIADCVNSSSEPYGGAITAALFLQQFVSKKVDWVHIDLMGMNVNSRPGRSKGGEAQSLRAVFDVITYLN